MTQEMTGWHQLDHMQIICTSIQTDNYASTSPINFYTLDFAEYWSRDGAFTSSVQK